MPTIIPQLAVEVTHSFIWRGVKSSEALLDALQSGFRAIMATLGPLTHFLLGRSFSLYVLNNRPFARGKISLQSSNAADHPVIDINYLGDQRGARLFMPMLSTHVVTAATHLPSQWFVKRSELQEDACDILGASPDA